MKTIKHSIDEYKKVSNDVWLLFKKYFPDQADTSTFTDDVQLLTKKYNYNPRTYEFYAKLCRVYFQELFELKELKIKQGDDFNTIENIYKLCGDSIKMLQLMQKELGDLLDGE